MKQTFTTTMPDRVGAFSRASECISRLGLNITRVSYNKAVDTHMLFIEVEGEEGLLAEAEQQLAAIGYLQSAQKVGSVLLLEFRLEDHPGTLQPVVQLIGRYHFNISYISSQEDGSGYQAFKMGLFVEDDRKVSEFMQEAALLCPVRVIDYDKSERVLDNTVFYLNFAKEISEKMHLTEAEKRELILQSNRIMQMLDEQNGPAYKTFDYIHRFADHIKRHKGAGFRCRITRRDDLTLIEPPCGSNLFLIERGNTLLCVDSGFACYREEQLALLRELFPDFDRRKKILLLTHPDVDHCGCTELFDEVYLSDRSCEDFCNERKGLPAYREVNPTHAPYAVLSKLLSGYYPPDPTAFHCLGKASGKELLERIGTLELEGLCFEVYEGSGSHVKGETVFIERTRRMAITGDIYVNIKGFTKEQAQFNKLAPYLMTSVDTDPVAARAEREALFALLGPGDWTIIGGHGSLCKIEI
ncbi:MAG: Zn-dependent hydrolase [Clostridia bacterium]|nr:Zn-dependent hydrolase [Clostridia bacterium]